MRPMLRVYSLSLPLPILMPFPMIGNAMTTTTRLTRAMRHSTTNSQTIRNSIEVNAETASGTMCARKSSSLSISSPSTR